MKAAFYIITLALIGMIGRQSLQFAKAAELFANPAASQSAEISSDVAR